MRHTWMTGVSAIAAIAAMAGCAATEIDNARVEQGEQGEPAASAPETVGEVASELTCVSYNRKNTCKCPGGCWATKRACGCFKL